MVREMREAYEHRGALMKAIVMKNYGTPDVLALREVAMPTPKANEALVRVHAAAVNDWDWDLLQGSLFTRMFHGLFKPRVQILGGDIAGRVEAVGEDVNAFQPGDEVYGDLCMSGFGAFAEYVCAPEMCLAHKPATMTYEQAAAIPQAGMLAVQGLIDVGRIQSGQRLLLNGAGGGVGTFALQMAKLHDDVEVTVVDKRGKLDMLRAMGADHVVDYLEEDFTKSGKRYDLILDTKTNRSPISYARAMNPNGTYVTVGGNLKLVLLAFVLKPMISLLYNKHIHVVVLKPNKDLAYMNELFEAGKLVPVTDGPYKLAKLSEAFRFFGTGDYKGKIIVTMT